MPRYKFKKPRNRRQKSKPVNAPKLPITIVASQLDIVGGDVVMSAEFDQPLGGWIVGQVKAPQVGVSARLTRFTGPATFEQFDLVATSVTAVSLAQFEFRFASPVGGVIAGDVVQLAFSEACASWAFNASSEGIHYLADDLIAQPIEAALVVTKQNGVAAPAAGAAISGISWNQLTANQFEVLLVADGPVDGWSAGPVYPVTLPACPGLTIRANIQGDMFPCVVEQAVFHGQSNVIVTVTLGGGGVVDVPMNIECAFDAGIGGAKVDSTGATIPEAVLATFAVFS